MEQAKRPEIPGFHVMAKPIGPICNLDCEYCFYLEKESLYPGEPKWQMQEPVLSRFVQEYIAAQTVPEITFAWQGGEPTLLGVDFFRRAVRLQEEHGDGRTIHNAFQTNGVLLNDEWCAFLKEHNFLVGLSVDGPEEIHNRYRLDKGGHGSFKRVMGGLEALKKHGVEFNTLTCVNRHNSNRPLAVYRFLREAGSGFMQFIPIVERVSEHPDPDGLTLPAPTTVGGCQVSEWSVEPRAYGRFLSTIFDDWVRRDVGVVFVQMFDIALEAWLGRNPSLCVFRDTCGDAMALEHNGDVYSCDHFVYPEYRLGNVMEDGLAKMVNSDFQRKFGTDKRDTLPRYCRECPVLFACNGECPKHRFATTPDGEPGLSYLCEGYRHFFQHIDPEMRFMAGELRAGRPAANVMEHVRTREAGGGNGVTAGPNDPCPCGSGRKFKKCCGRSA